MPKQTATLPALTAAQSSYILDELIRRRKVSAADIRSCLSEMTREIARLEARLGSLRQAAGARSHVVRSAPAPDLGVTATGAPRKRRRPNLSPARRAQLRLQGHYLSLMRHTPATKRPGFRKIRMTRGLQAAVDALKKA